MKAEIYNCFILAAGEVLKTELDVDVDRGQLSLQRNSYVTNDITVLISLVGDVSGIVFHSLEFATAKNILSVMLGQEVEHFDELAQSGIAELGNVIAGAASTKIGELGLYVNISVPTLIVGKGTTISTLDIDRLIVPLQTSAGVLRLDLAIREAAPTGMPAGAQAAAR